MQEFDAEADMLRGLAAYVDGLEGDHAVPEAEGKTWSDDEVASDLEVSGDDDVADDDKTDDMDKTKDGKDKVVDKTKDGKDKMADNQDEVRDKTMVGIRTSITVPAAGHTSLPSSQGRTSCRSLLHRCKVVNLSTSSLTSARQLQLTTKSD